MHTTLRIKVALIGDESGDTRAVRIHPLEQWSHMGLKRIVQVLRLEPLRGRHITRRWQGCAFVQRVDHITLGHYSAAPLIA